MCIFNESEKINCGDEKCPHNGTKIINLHENPIDAHLIKLCKIVAEHIRFHDTRKVITPNMLTTVGLILGLISLVLISRKKYYLAFVFFWLCYFFDCIDGYYARRYKMTSQFGDYYDHFRDIIINGVVLILIYQHLNTRQEKNTFVIIGTIALILMLTHLGCQELNSAVQKDNICLKFLSPLSKKKEHIKYTKYVGNGTYILVISLFILYLGIKQQLLAQRG